MKPSLIFNRTQTPRNIKVKSPKLEINISSLTKNLTVNQFLLQIGKSQ